MAAQVTSTNQGTISVDYANPLLRYVQTLPAPVRERCQEAFQRATEALGVTGDIMAVPHARIPRAAGLAYLRIVLELSGDPLAPIHVGLGAQRDDWGILSYLSSTAETLGQSVRALAKYVALLDDTAALDVAVDEAFVTVSLRRQQGVDLPSEAVEMALSSLLSAGSENLGFPTAPTRVHFRHAAPAHAEHHARLLRAPTHFAQAFDGWVFPAEAQGIPQRSANPTLHRLLSTYADELLQRLPRRRSALQEVRDLMLQRLDETPSAESLAASLAIGERTLRRRLQSNGYTVTTLLEDVRRNEATRLLTHSHMSISEVAFALGFSQPSAFHRAFRRWFGMPPRAYRRTTVGSPLQAFLTGPASEAG